MATRQEESVKSSTRVPFLKGFLSEGQGETPDCAHQDRIPRPLRDPSHYSYLFAVHRHGPRTRSRTFAGTEDMFLTGRLEGRGPPY